MKKGIALVELFGHSEVLYNYNRILGEAGYEVENYTTEAIYLDAPPELRTEKSISWVQKTGDQTVPAFLNGVKRELNECRAVIFITIAEPLSFFSRFQLSTPSVVVVHDYYAFFEGSRHFMLATDSFGLFVKDLLKLIRYFIRRESKLTLRAVSNFDAWVVPSESVYQFVRNQKNPLVDRLAGSLDFAMFEEAVPERDGEPVTSIVIPGIVSNKSRDYFLILKTLAGLSGKLKQKIRIILLGSPKGDYGHKVISGFRKIASPELEVITFSGYIEQKTFDCHLKAADFLLLPIKRKMKYSIFGEWNGYSCVSGNVNDILRFGIPAILPAFYPLDEELQPLVETYGNKEELKVILKRWLTEKTYLSKRKQALACCQKFSKEVLAGKFREIIESVISGAGQPPSFRN